MSIRKKWTSAFFLGLLLLLSAACAQERAGPEEVGPDTVSLEEEAEPEINDFPWEIFTDYEILAGGGREHVLVMPEYVETNSLEDYPAVADIADQYNLYGGYWFNDEPDPTFYIAQYDLNGDGYLDYIVQVLKPLRNHPEDLPQDMPAYIGFMGEGGLTDTAKVWGEGIGLAVMDSSIGVYADLAYESNLYRGLLQYDSENKRYVSHPVYSYFYFTKADINSLLLRNDGLVKISINFSSRRPSIYDGDMLYTGIVIDRLTPYLEEPILWNRHAADEYRAVPGDTYEFTFFGKVSSPADYDEVAGLLREGDLLPDDIFQAVNFLDSYDWVPWETLEDYRVLGIGGREHVLEMLDATETTVPEEYPEIMGLITMVLEDVEEYGIPDPYYYVSHYDLNDDGLEDVIVQVNAMGYGSSRGLPTFIGIARPDGTYTHTSLPVGGRIAVMDTSTDGFHDLAYSNSEFRYVYCYDRDENQYVEKPENGPASFRHWLGQTSYITSDLAYVHYTVTYFEGSTGGYDQSTIYSCIVLDALTPFLEEEVLWLRTNEHSLLTFEGLNHQEHYVGKIRDDADISALALAMRNAEISDLFFAERNEEANE